VQSLKRLKRLEGKPSANCLASDGYFTRNSSNYITERIDDEGRVTKFTRDSRGNPTQIIEAYGTADQRTTTITWHSSFSLPTKIAKTGLTIELAYDASGRLVTRKEIDTTTHTIPYATAGETRVWSYAYSRASRLSTASGAWGTDSYAYDAVGNRLSFTRDISGSSFTSAYS
jgi:YD repeat-containing protein